MRSSILPSKELNLRLPKIDLINRDIFLCGMFLSNFH